MEGLVESIVSKGKRTEEQWEAAKKIDEAHQKELRLVLEKVKLLWYDKNHFPSSATNHSDGIQTRRIGSGLSMCRLTNIALQFSRC